MRRFAQREQRTRRPILIRFGNFWPGQTSPFLNSKQAIAPCPSSSPDPVLPMRRPNGHAPERAASASHPGELAAPPRDRVAVIIVNYNGGDYLERCIAGLKNQRRSPDRCLLIDNASQGIPIHGDEPWLETLELVRPGSNLGFAAANNLAVRQCEDVDWIALLNPDAYPAPDWLENLMAAARQHPEYVSFASRQLDAANDTLLDGAGDGLTTSGRPFRRGLGLNADEHLLSKDLVFSPCGAAALYQREAFLAAGGFDEDFFCYLEDIDLGFRLKLQGHACLYVPDAIVHHEGSALTGRRSDFATYHGHRNLLWVYWKNMPWRLFLTHLPEHIMVTFAAFWACARRGQAGVFLKAKRDAVKGLPAILRKRKQVQQSRSASLAFIDSSLTSELGCAFKWMRRRFFDADGSTNRP